MRGISKAYGSLVANDGIDLTLYAGEVNALIGENGAGKTTLMNILFGLIAADRGEIWLGETLHHFESPHDALESGVGMVHQHFMLVPDLTVAENVVLGTVSPLNPHLKRFTVEQDVAKAAEEFGIDVDVRARASTLPVEIQQRVEILKLLYRGAQILILDEPTAGLGPAQIESLLDVLSSLRAEGRTIVIVTHKLPEVLAIADRVTVLKRGKCVLTGVRGDFDAPSLARAMTGREIPKLLPRSQRTKSAQTIKLQVDGLFVEHRSDRHGVNLSFEVHAAEILGVAGVEGNGQQELFSMLTGAIDADTGSVEVNGRDVTNLSPAELHRAGVAAVPADRKRSGLVSDMSVSENLVLAAIPAGDFDRGGFLARKAIAQRAKELIQSYGIVPPDPDLPVQALSGGNQQKVVLARELSSSPRVLVAANPTQGLDVGAAAEVHRRLLEVREGGAATLLISYDLDELLQLSDRIIVMHRGELAYEALADGLDIDELGLAMAGHRPV